MENIIINRIKESFHISANQVNGTDAIDWDRLDFSPYTTSQAEAFRKRYSKFPEEFYTALELAETKRNRQDEIKFILKYGLLKKHGRFLISFN